MTIEQEKEVLSRMVSWEILHRTPVGPIVGAEIGVNEGNLSAALLAARSDLRLYMIDSYGLSSDVLALYRSNAEGVLRLPQHIRALLNTEFAAPRATLLLQDSLAAAPGLKDLDFAFIDADHGYEAVTADIEAWSQSVKRGGLLGGHDYGGAYPGVMQAVNEAVHIHKWTLDLGAYTTWFVRV